VTPAPVWRRLAAAGYDALVLAAIAMAVTLLVTLLDQLVPISSRTAIMRAALLIVGGAFFGWFWSHGGQTLGMRAWRLRVLRIDGAPLSIPAASLRYLLALLPLIGALYVVARLGSTSAIGLALIVYAPCFFNARRRAFHDLLSGTEVLLLPPRDRSTQLPQPPERDDDQQEGRQAG